MRKRAILWGLLAIPILVGSPARAQTPPSPAAEYRYSIDIGVMKEVGDMFLDWRRDELYVLDKARRHVEVMDLEGMPVFNFHVASKESELEPRAIVVDSRGTIYVLQYHWRKQVIEEYNHRGVLIGRFELSGHPELAETKLTGLGIDRRDNVWVIDTGTMRAMAFARGGSFLRQVSAEGKEFAKAPAPSQFADIMFDEQNRLHLLDAGLAKIFVYRHDGKFLRTYGRRGQIMGTLGRPTSLDIGRTGLAFVCDTVHHLITVYNQEGKFVGEVGGRGDGRGRFYFPKLTATDRKGKIFVIDSVKRHGIQVFEEIAPGKPTSQAVSRPVE